jgi:CheY-like chemotaxis protein/HPt (histidine-containing phosphotransfer) domain-containing protein
VLIGTLLRRQGLVVKVVENGQLALDAAKEGHPFDLVLMDIQMPTMDGLEATRQLRARGFGGPVVALTANAMAGERERCLDAGCDDYLTKPVDREEFLRMLTRYLGTTPVPPDELLHSDFADDPEMTDLVVNFVGSLPERMEELRQVAARGQGELLRMRVHQLKGAAGGYGFPAITVAAARAERALADGASIEEVTEQLEALIQLCRRARTGPPLLG